MMQEKLKKFPLIQLPRKSEEVIRFIIFQKSSNKFPLIQLPRKSEVIVMFLNCLACEEFPLIQLPRKSEASFAPRKVY